MEDEESLEACALISKFTDPVKYKVDNLLSDGVVTTSVIVGGIFFAGDELLWVEQLAVGASAHLVCKNAKRVHALSVGGATTLILQKKCGKRPAFLCRLTHLRRWAQGRQTLLGAHACQRQSR